MTGENPGSDPRTVAELDAYFERSKQHKRLIAHEVILNVAFFAGDQDSVWESVSGRLRRVELPWKSNMFHNIVLSTIIGHAAKLLKNRPGWLVAPGSTDDNVVAAAKGAEKLLDYYYRKGGLRAVLQDAFINADVAGISWIKVVWDWSRGRNLDTLEGTWTNGPTGKTPETSGLGGFDGQGAQMGSADPMGGSPLTGAGEADSTGVTGSTKEGDLAFSVVDFFMGFPDPNQLKPGDPAQRFMEVHRMTRREVQARWPERAKFVQATPVVADDQFGTVYQSAVFEGVLGYGSPAEQGRDSANEIILVKEYVELPSPAHVNGRLVQYAHNTVLYDGDLPGRRVYYFPIWHIKHPRRFWPIPLATELRTLNHEYNRTRRQQIEYNELMAKGAWMIPAGSGVTRESLVARHGLQITYRPVGFNKPEQIQLKPFPDMEPHLNRVIGDSQDAAAVREITKGYAPPNVGAASALAMLQEQDDTASGPIRLDLEDQISAIGEYALELIHDNMEFPRKFELVGDTGEWMIQEFDKTNVQPWKVYVESGSMLPKSKYAQVQTFKDLWEMGLILDENKQPDYKMAARMLQGEFYRPEVFREERVAEDGAKRENEMLKEGQPVTVLPEEDHDLHVRIHTNLIMLLKFRTDPASQMAIQAARMHIQQHLMALSAQMPPPPPVVTPASPTGPGGGGVPPGPPPPGTPGGRAPGSRPAMANGPAPGMSPERPRGSIEPVAGKVGLNRGNGGLG